LGQRPRVVFALEAAISCGARLEPVSAIDLPAPRTSPPAAGRKTLARAEAGPARVRQPPLRSMLPCAGAANFHWPPDFAADTSHRFLRR
jgi:hypothetical protein